MIQYSNFHGLLDRFPEVWTVDFEFQSKPGETPVPICVTAFELKSQRVVKEWLMGGDYQSPFYGSNSCLVAYYAMAELSCILKLNWPLPRSVIDLYVEHKNHTNIVTDFNSVMKSKASVLDALKHHGLSGIGYEEKEHWRGLCIQGGPFSEADKVGLIEYCYSDVIACLSLVRKMIPKVDIDRAILRGEYLKSLSKVEARGIPIDVKLYDQFIELLPDIKQKLIDEVNKKVKVFDGSVFKENLFEKVIHEKKIKWPRTETGKLKIDADTFKDLSAKDSDLCLIRDIRDILGKVKDSRLPVGIDGRCRTMLSPFSSKTSRNQPSTTKFPFGLTAALRGFVKPNEGMAMAYIDYSQQEYAIAAALSGDEKMLSAYQSGDPYLQFAIDSGLAPKSATKRTHSKIRDHAKQLILAVQYCMGPESLAYRLNQSSFEAKRLLDLHKSTYSKFWEWAEQVEHLAFIEERVLTNLGWQILPQGNFNKRTIRNFPMQANGAEILRISIILLDAEGIRVIAPVHDAVLIEAPVYLIDDHTERAKEIMAEASGLVLKGLKLRSDSKIIKYPERYEDERGKHLWNMIYNEVSREDRHVCKLN